MFRRFIHIMLLILSFIPFSVLEVKAQEFPSSLQYITNMHTINPSFVGIWDKAGFMVSTRTNWLGIKGAPLYQKFSYFSPIKNKESGFAFNVERITQGIEKKLSFTGDYAYQVRLDVYTYLRLGLRAGFVNYNNDLTDYKLYPDYVPDPEFSTDVNLFFMSVLGVGAMIYNDDYFVSLSIPQIMSNTFRVNLNNYSSEHRFTNIYLSGSYVFKLPNNIRLRPNLMLVGSIGKSVYADAAAIVYLPSNLQLGINMRSNGTVCFSAQYVFTNNMRIGYAADYALISDIRKYQLGTYEFLVGYDFNLYRRKNTRVNYF